MFKRLVLFISLLTFSLSITAQERFAHFNHQAILTLMPEFIQAQADIDALSNRYQQEIDTKKEEMTQKLQAFMQDRESLPPNILMRRQKELEEMNTERTRLEQEASQAVQQASQTAMTGIDIKLKAAVEAVGIAEGFIYIFDVAQTPIPYIGIESMDVTDKVKKQLGLQ